MPYAYKRAIDPARYRAYNRSANQTYYGPTKTSRPYLPWSEWEDFLILNPAGMSDKQLAAYLGRPLAGLQIRRCRLKK